MQQITFSWENVWDRLNFFLQGYLYRRAGFTSPARHRGDGGASRETDSSFSTLRAHRAGHGARARVRLATDESPVDSPSAEASGAEIFLASPSRKRPAVRKKHNYTLLYRYSYRTLFLYSIFCTVKVKQHGRPRERELVDIDGRVSDYYQVLW